MNRSLRNIGWLGIVLWLLFGCVHKPQETVDALPYCEEDTTAWGLLTTDGTVAAPSGTWGQAPSAVVNGRFTATDTHRRLLSDRILLRPGHCGAAFPGHALCLAGP